MQLDVDLSEICGLLRTCVGTSTLCRVATWAATSSMTRHLPSVLTTAVATSTASTVIATLVGWGRASQTYRWLTIDPEPVSKRIDLRDTVTISPFARATDRVVDTLRSAWPNAVVARVTTSSALEAALAGAFVVDAMAAVLTPPPPPTTDEPPMGNRGSENASSFESDS